MTSVALTRRRLPAGWSWGLGVGALAFAVRLVTVLRGGGLFGRIGYDGSVYYASASALTHGVLPYRDFLLLHPPGVVLALLPFAAVGRLVGDPYGLALARLGWFALGGVSAGLAFTVLRPRELRPALVAGGVYAVLVPAVVSDHTTSLETVGTVCLLGAVLLVTRARPTTPRAGTALVAAGGLLGFAAGTKIWGVAVALALVAWAARRFGLRRAGLLLAGAVGGAVVVCLPFFLAAPGAMWRMVVADQLGRRRVPGGLTGRVVDIAGLSPFRSSGDVHLLAVAVGVVGVAVLVLALREPLGRLAAVLLLTTTAVLLASPPWSVQYTGLTAPAVALLVGAATARTQVARGWIRSVAPWAVGALLAAYAVATLPGLTFGSRFPGTSLGAVFARQPGCVTTDDPIALVETGALQRNLSARCPVVLDVGGYSYDLQPGASRHVGRAANHQWQTFVREHLASGGAAVVVRFRHAPGLSAATRKAVDQWPTVGSSGGYDVRRPPSVTAAGR